MFQWRVICIPCCTNDSTEDNFVRSDVNTQICFLKLALILPLYCILAISSTYYIGLKRFQFQRSPFQKWILNVRSCIVIFLVLIPIVFTGMFIFFDPLAFAQIDILLTIVECISWILHFNYVLCLRNSFSRNSRGPIFMCILWYFLFVFELLRMKYYWDFIVMNDTKLLFSILLSYTTHIIRLILFALYGLTLLPGEKIDIIDTPVINLKNICTNIGREESSEYIQLMNNTEHLGFPLENASFFSKMNFSWVNDLICKGEENKLNDVDDLFDLSPNLCSENLGLKLEEVLENHNKIHVEEDIIITDHSYKNSLFKSLHKAFGLEFYLIGLIKLIAEFSSFLSPILLKQFISFTESHDKNNLNGYFYASGLILSVIISSYLTTHYDFRVSIVCLKIRSSLSSAIYRKLLRISTVDIESNLNSGEILNFISTDVDRIVNACPSFHAFWSCPLQIIVILYLLYCQIGLIFVISLTASIFLIILNKWIATKISNLSTELLKWKDQRVKLMTEVLFNIKVIKFNAWEGFFLKKLTDTRNLEMRVLKFRKYLDSICVYFWATSSVTTLFFTIIVYVLWGHNLTAPTIFTAIALLNMLIVPLNSLPWIFFGLVDFWISLKRIQRLFNIDDLNLKAFYVERDDNFDIVLNEVDFSWNKEEVVLPQLKGLNLKVKKGESLGIFGPTGCGKSTLLTGILAELNKLNGDVFLNGFHNGIGYVGQQVWLQRGSIRENILFGRIYDDVKYRKILQACCLIPDIKALKKGDLTNVGENGCLLSGGQRVRVALARAIYQEMNIYLFDDIFSAIDSNVAKEIFENCFNSLLKHKTIILATHKIEILNELDNILQFTTDGKLIQVVQLEDTWNYKKEYIDDSCINTSDIVNCNFSKVDEIKEYWPHGILKLSVLKFYINKIGYVISLCILLSIVSMQVLQNLCYVSLAKWIDNNQISLVDGAQLKIYILLVITNNIIAILRSFIFAYGNLKAAKLIHERLLKTIIKGTMYFFDTQPIGRILNRFSSDIATIDDNLPFIINIFLAITFILFGSIIVIVTSMPLVLIILIPVYPIYHYVQNRYRSSSRDLKRLSSVTLSPIYSHFSDSYKGLRTIRAFKNMQHVINVNNHLLDNNIKAQFSSQAVSRWLNLQLQKIGIFLICGVCSVALIYHYMDITDVGLVALAITYSLNITSVLSGVITSFVETEREMISVERVYEYIESVPKEILLHSRISPPFGWPTQGVISFNNVIFNHMSNSEPTLKGITFQTRPAEKIGIIGRTGAGKSSLLAALFRLNKVTSGSILIDNVNIEDISLNQLRSRISIIAQENFTFSGSIRENIDPQGHCRDFEIWEALEKCDLIHKIEKFGGLDVEFDSNNIKLSTGEKQLLCLTRTVLKNTKIVCFDEATGNIDYETDKKIQNYLKTLFRNKTVLTIAHRVQTVEDCDRILIIDDGRIIEFDSPENLINNSNSYFTKIIKGNF